jgi:hypothetical protein
VVAVWIDSGRRKLLETPVATAPALRIMEVMDLVRTGTEEEILERQMLHQPAAMAPRVMEVSFASCVLNLYVGLDDNQI